MQGKCRRKRQIGGVARDSRQSRGHVQSLSQPALSSAYCSGGRKGSVGARGQEGNLQEGLYVHISTTRQDQSRTNAYSLVLGDSIASKDHNCHRRIFGSCSAECTRYAACRNDCTRLMARYMKAAGQRGRMKKKVLHSNCQNQNCCDGEQAQAQHDLNLGAASHGLGIDAD